MDEFELLQQELNLRIDAMNKAKDALGAYVARRVMGLELGDIIQIEKSRSTMTMRVDKVRASNLKYISVFGPRILKDNRVGREADEMIWGKENFTLLRRSKQHPAPAAQDGGE